MRRIDCPFAKEELHALYAKLLSTADIATLAGALLKRKVSIGVAARWLREAEVQMRPPEQSIQTAWSRGVMNRSTPITKKLMKKIDKRGENDCWLWKGAVSGTSYSTPVIAIDRKNKSAKRVLWNLVYGYEPPRDMFIIQTCGNGLCMNPAHFALTKKPN